MAKLKQPAKKPRMVAPPPEPKKDRGIDPHEHYRRLVAKLAREVGVDPEALIDEWWMRCSARWYGGESIDVAEAEAWQDVQERFAARRAA